MSLSSLIPIEGKLLMDSDLLGILWRPRCDADRVCVANSGIDFLAVAVADCIATGVRHNQQVGIRGHREVVINAILVRGRPGYGHRKSIGALDHEQETCSWLNS